MKFEIVEAARYLPSIPVRSASEHLSMVTSAEANGLLEASVTWPVTNPRGVLAWRKKYMPEEVTPRHGDAATGRHGDDVIREPETRAKATSFSFCTPRTSMAFATIIGRFGLNPAGAGMESSAEAERAAPVMVTFTARSSVKSEPTTPETTDGFYAVVSVTYTAMLPNSEKIGI